MQALDALTTQYPAASTFRRFKEFFIDEITFIEKFGFDSLAAYRGAERVGRAAAYLSRKNREWIYMAYETYIELRGAAGHKHDWDDDLAFYVYTELKEDHSARLRQKGPGRSDKLGEGTEAIADDVCQCHVFTIYSHYILSSAIIRSRQVNPRVWGS